jgi:hypothetical protein
MANQLTFAKSIGDGVRGTVRHATTTAAGMTGSVVGRFSAGFYVASDAGLFCIGGPCIPAGPIHLVLERIPPLPPEGSIVRLGYGYVWTESGTIALSRAVRYSPDQPSPRTLHAIAPVLAVNGHRDAVPDDVAHLWTAVRIAIERQDIHSARQLLQGVGSGLTPTGDDVLAGIVLFVRWAEPLSQVPSEVAQQAATTLLSRQFLAWAARGQSVQPVHDMIEAARQLEASKERAFRSGGQNCFEQAVATVASIGGTSGKGMLAGLALAASTWPLALTEDASRP